MDISNNIHDLAEAMYEYQRNIRYYTDNIRDYNQNINTYLNIINNSPPIINNLGFRDYRPIFQPTPITNVFRNINQRRDEGNMFQPTTFQPTTFQQRFEDVVVRPTEAQITRALDFFSYSPMEESHTCPITLETIQEGDEVCRIRQCGHIFKRSAIEGWFLRNVRCPVCRYDIRDYVPVTNDISGNPVPVSQNDDSTEFDDLIQEIAEEGRSFMNQRPLANLFSATPIANTMTNAIRSFINNELQRMPVTDTTTELLYSFDIPLTIDASGNYRL
jgi:hypothetical protein